VIWNSFLPADSAPIGVVVAKAWNGAQSNNGIDRGHPRCVTRHRRSSDARQFYLKSIDKIAQGKLAPKHASRT
jgi:hypothetical protein